MKIDFEKLPYISKFLEDSLVAYKSFNKGIAPEIINSLYNLDAQLIQKEKSISMFREARLYELTKECSKNTITWDTIRKDKKLEDLNFIQDFLLFNALKDNEDYYTIQKYFWYGEEIQ